MEEAKTAEEVVKPKRKAPAKKDYLYNSDDFEIKKVMENGEGMLVEKRVWKPEIKSHLAKCQARACREMGVNSLRLSQVYNTLNGRKIDGFYVNEMIDRYGYSDGIGVNRAQLAAKHGQRVNALLTACEKLRKIAQAPDPLKAYMKYIKEYEDLLLKARRDDVVDGE